jgi:hypothetical protein
MEGLHRAMDPDGSSITVNFPTRIYRFQPKEELDGHLRH